MFKCLPISGKKLTTEILERLSIYAKNSLLKYLNACLSQAKN